MIDGGVVANAAADCELAILTVHGQANELTGQQGTAAESRVRTMPISPSKLMSPAVAFVLAVGCGQADHRNVAPADITVQELHDAGTAADAVQLGHALVVRPLCTVSSVELLGSELATACLQLCSRRSAMLTTMMRNRVLSTVRPWRFGCRPDTA